MTIDIRDRVICTAFSSVTTEKEVRASMALSSEQSLRGFVVDNSTYNNMLSDVKEHKNVGVAINFPFQGMTKSATIFSILEIAEIPKVNDLYISLDKFDVTRQSLTNIRDFIKEANQVFSNKINFAIEYSWINSTETLDKVCSILEPYEKHGLIISTYCKKPDKLSDVLAVGSHLNSNGSCKYSYFGALPKNKEGVIEILSSGFVSCAIPKQFLSMII